MNNKPDLHVVSFSGGKDSTAMLLRMKEIGMKIDMILYCDTGLEFSEMYEHIKHVEQYVGINIIRLKSEKPFEYWFLEHEVKRKNPKLQGLKGYSWSDSRNRWCTSQLKTKVIEQYLSGLSNSFNVIQYIGIAADETKRIRDKQYPLVEWNWTEADCLKYCYEKGFDFGGGFTNFLIVFHVGAVRCKVLMN